MKQVRTYVLDDGVKRGQVRLCDEHAKELGDKVTIIDEARRSPPQTCVVCKAEQEHPVLRAMFPTAWDRVDKEREP